MIHPSEEPVSYREARLFLLATSVSTVTVTETTTSSSYTGINLSKLEEKKLYFLTNIPKGGGY